MAQVRRFLFPGWEDRNAVFCPYTAYEGGEKEYPEVQVIIDFFILRIRGRKSFAAGFGQSLLLPVPADATGHPKLTDKKYKKFKSTQ